jgi:hypothetical protein
MRVVGLIIALVLGACAIAPAGEIRTPPPSMSLCKGSSEVVGQCFSGHGTLAYQIVVLHGIDAQNRGFAKPVLSPSLKLDGDNRLLTFPERQGQEQLLPSSLPAPARDAPLPFEISGDFEVCPIDVGKVVLKKGAVDILDVCMESATNVVTHQPSSR